MWGRWTPWLASCACRWALSVLTVLGYDCSIRSATGGVQVSMVRGKWLLRLLARVAGGGEGRGSWGSCISRPRVHALVCREGSKGEKVVCVCVCEGAWLLMGLAACCFCPHLLNHAH